MNNQQLASAMSRSVEKIAGAVRSMSAVDQAVEHAAIVVKNAATAAGDSVGIKVTKKGAHSVSISVQGRNASKYKKLIRESIDKQMPGVKADIKAQIVRASK